jgi:hypothetical protein
MLTMAGDARRAAALSGCALVNRSGVATWTATPDAASTAALDRFTGVPGACEASHCGLKVESTKNPATRTVTV